MWEIDGPNLLARSLQSAPHHPRNRPLNDNQAPVGLRRALLRARAYIQLGFWMAKELNPWRKPYGKRR
jgi:hypothetical protein